MKKQNLKIIGAALAVLALTGCSKAAEETTVKENSIKPDNYVGSWESVRPTVEISKEATNTYDVKVTWGSSAFETTVWDYTCNYDEENNNLDCSGSKTNYVFDEDGKEDESDVVYEDGKATFTLNDSILTWNDQKEDSGDGIEFTKYDE